MRIALVIPSVGRAEFLGNALASARALAPDLYELIVVAQAHDSATSDVAHSFGAQLVPVERPGLAWAMREGARASSGDVVAFTDDDAELTQDWFERLVSAYEDPRVGGVGGRDRQPEGDAYLGSPGAVGQIDKLGRVVGGHHAATGQTRQVAHLKGVNCSFRRDLFVVYDSQALVAGEGAQVRNELVVCLGISKLGFSIVFDPELVVDHHPAPRQAGDDRHAGARKSYESAHNEVLAFYLARHPLRRRNLAMLTLVGYRHSPGLLRALIPASRPLVQATLRGAWAGRRLALRNQNLAMRARVVLEKST